jgi:predicted NACHT family NTPase
LHRKFQQLKEQLPPAFSYSWERDEHEQWWKDNGQTWTERFRETLIQYRNIGRDWQFTKEQKDLLQQYYDANLLLAACLNSDCYVSREVREEIEAKLLLPSSSLR